MNLLEYYRHPSVRARIGEYLGDPAGAVYLTDNDYARDPQPLSRLADMLSSVSELNRSLWDRRNLLVHLDVEYVNFDRPWEAYLNPSRIFFLQRPVVDAVHAVLAEHALASLHLLSGRGHHFVWAVPQEHPTFARLASLGRQGPELPQDYACPQAPDGSRVGEALGAAFAGTSLVMEYLAHRVLERLHGACPVSVQLTAVEVGALPQGREIVSLDLSEYGDPLHRRTLRVPFSLYLKAEHLRARVGDGLEAALFPLVMVPIHEMDVFQSSIAMRDLGQAAGLAERSSCLIPEQPRGMGRLLDSYAASSLAEFHRWFYARDSEVGDAWPGQALEQLPPCVSQPLRHPNDRLLKPAVLQHVTRALLALGWHPRHIAGLVLRLFEEDHGWQPGVHFHNARTRAEFYVRMFAGLFAVGREDLTDFNCVSTREKGYCPGACSDDLEDLRRSALERRRTLALGRPPYQPLEARR